jgi:hypothetical protein
MEQELWRRLGNLIPGKGMEGRAAGVGGAIDEVVCLLGPLLARHLASCVFYDAEITKKEMGIF